MNDVFYIAARSLRSSIQRSTFLVETKDCTALVNEVTQDLEDAYLCVDNMQRGNGQPPTGFLITLTDTVHGLPHQNVGRKSPASYSRGFLSRCQATAVRDYSEPRSY